MHKEKSVFAYICLNMLVSFSVYTKEFNILSNIVDDNWSMYNCTSTRLDVTQCDDRIIVCLLNFKQELMELMGYKDLQALLVIH